MRSLFQKATSVHSGWQAHPGTVALSFIVVLTFLVASAALASEPLNLSSISKLYPVPTRDQLNIVVRGDVHGYRLIVARVNGRRVWQQDFSPSDGQYHTISLDTSRFRTGLYSLTYRSDLPGGAYAVRRFIIIR
jgi:hypothetical protein